MVTSWVITGRIEHDCKQPSGQNFPISPLNGETYFERPFDECDVTSCDIPFDQLPGFHATCATRVRMSKMVAPSLRASAHAVSHWVRTFGTVTVKPESLVKQAIVLRLLVFMSISVVDVSIVDQLFI
jgi:hypothetical protein